MGVSTDVPNGHIPSLRYIDLAFDNNSLDDSARALAFEISPEWRQASGEIKITKFTDGITNIVRANNAKTEHVPRLTSIHSYSKSPDILLICRKQKSTTSRSFSEHMETTLSSSSTGTGKPGHMLCAQSEGWRLRY